MQILSSLSYPPQLKALHPVFNIDRLKPYVANNQKFASRPQRFDRPPPEADSDTNGDKVFEVERIIAARGRGRSLRYLVAWKGYPPEENTWEPRSAFITAREALDEFEATHGRAQPLNPITLGKTIGNNSIVQKPVRGRRVGTTVTRTEYSEGRCVGRGCHCPPHAGRNCSHRPSVQCSCPRSNVPPHADLCTHCARDDAVLARLRRPVGGSQSVLDAALAALNAIPVEG